MVYVKLKTPTMICKSNKLKLSLFNLIMKSFRDSFCPWRSCMRDVIIFLMCFLLAKKDIELVGQVHKLSMELSSRVENQSVAALVKICEKVFYTLLGSEQFSSS